MSTCCAHVYTWSGGASVQLQLLTGKGSGSPALLSCVHNRRHFRSISKPLDLTLALKGAVERRQGERLRLHTHARQCNIVLERKLQQL